MKPNNMTRERDFMVSIVYFKYLKSNGFKKAKTMTEIAELQNQVNKCFNNNLIKRQIYNQKKKSGLDETIGYPYILISIKTNTL